MNVPQGAEQLARKMAALDREIVALAQQLEQHRATERDDRQLRLRLDRLRRRRRLLDFYVPKKTEATVTGAEQPEADRRSAAGAGCVAAIALALLVGVGGGMWGFWRALEPEPAEPTIAVEAPPPVQAEPEPPPQPAAPPAPELERFAGAVERAGQVLVATGAVAVSRGDRCTVTVSPQHGRYNCRVVVRCAGQVLYGAEGAGYNRCAVEGGVPVRAEDRAADDGDPACLLDLTLGMVQIASDQPGQELSVAIRLQPSQPDGDAGSPSAAIGTAPTAERPALPAGSGRVPAPPASATAPAHPSPPPAPTPRPAPPPAGSGELLDPWK